MFIPQTSFLEVRGFSLTASGYKEPEDLYRDKNSPYIYCINSTVTKHSTKCSTLARASCRQQNACLL